jgi:hypothetical protein
LQEWRVPDPWVFVGTGKRAKTPYIDVTGDDAETSHSDVTGDDGDGSGGGGGDDGDSDQRGELVVWRDSAFVRTVVKCHPMTEGLHLGPSMLRTAECGLAGAHFTAADNLKHRVHSQTKTKKKKKKKQQQKNNDRRSKHLHWLPRGVKPKLPRRQR